MNIVELCRQFISIDSSIAHGTLDLVQFIEEKSKEWGLHTETVHENHNGQTTANVIIRPRVAEQSERPDFLLCTHIDTPDAGDYARWVKTGANPYNMSIDGEWAYGLGVADAKVDFVCKWLALREAALDAQQQARVAVVGTFGLASATGAIRLLRKKKIIPRHVLVGGATQLRLAGKGPGYARVEIHLPFTQEEREHQLLHNSAEASSSQTKIFTRPKEGQISHEILDNPIIKLMEYLKNLPAGVALLSVDGGTSPDLEPDQAFLELDLSQVMAHGIAEKMIKIGEALRRLSYELKSVQDADSSPGYSTITLGQVRTFPDGIQIVGSCRLIPSPGRDLYESWLERLRQECAAAGASLRILDYKPPFVANSGGPFLSYLKGVSSDCGLGGALVSAGQCNEANVFQRMGSECLVFGPGAWAYSDPLWQQRIKIDELETALNFYRKSLEGYIL